MTAPTTSAGSRWIRYWLACARCRFRMRPLVLSTDESPKWFQRHNTGCVWYAPEDICICKFVERNSARLIAARGGRG